MIDSEKRDFYVYIFLDQRKSCNLIYKEKIFEYLPFYVGVGCGGRLKVHFTPKNLTGKDIKTNIVNKIRRELNELPIHYRLFENLTQKEAFEIEIDMIKHFGKIVNKTGILANISDGGEGNLGLVHSEEYLDTLRRKIYQYALNGEFVREWRSLKHVTEHYRHSKNDSDDSRGFGWIKIVSREEKGTAIGFQWRSKFYDKLEPVKVEPKKVRIEKSKYYWELLDPESLEIVHVFKNENDTFEENHLEIEKFLGKKVSAGNVSAAATHKCNAYGYKWRRVCKKTFLEFKILHSPKKSRNHEVLDCSTS